MLFFVKCFFAFTYLLKRFGSLFSKNVRNISIADHAIRLAGCTGIHCGSLPALSHSAVQRLNYSCTQGTNLPAVSS
jgi:hypothetical protein